MDNEDGRDWRAGALQGSSPIPTAEWVLIEEEAGQGDERPLSFDAAPGPGTFLTELTRGRNLENASPEARRLLEAGWTRRDRGSDEFWTRADGIHYSMDSALSTLDREETQDDNAGLADSREYY